MKRCVRIGFGFSGLFSLVLAVAATGCPVAPNDEAADGDVASVDSSLTNAGVWMGSSSGWVYTTSGGIKSSAVESDHVFNAMRASNWPTSSPKRYSIVDWADWENYGEDMSRYGVPGVAKCGDEARAFYGAGAGKAWCSEYARFILRKAGLRNIRYCKTSFGVCLDYVYLKEADTVDDLVKLFSANGGWIHRASLTASSFEPGDYMALTTRAGEFKNHSAIVMAISSDKRWVYTSEGNVGDCVSYLRRDLYVNGALNPAIEGIGKVNVAF